MATTFPFPASPTVGQQITLTDGVTKLTWTGYSWEPVPFPYTLPVPVTDGGTGSTVEKYLQLTGGTLESSTSQTALTLKNTVSTVLNIEGGTNFGANIASKKGGLQRWNVALGDNYTESGGNVGANFQLVRYDDAGAPIGHVLFIDRKAGDVTLDGGVLNINKQPYYSGSLGMELTGAKTLVTVSSQGLTVGVAALTIQKAGMYLIMARQLMNTSGGTYFELRINNSVVRHGFMSVSTTGPLDVATHYIGNLAVGHYISFYITGTTPSSVWGAPHSDVSVIKVA